MSASARTPTLPEVINRGVQLGHRHLFKIRVGRIEKFDPATGLADVKPLQKETRDEDGQEDVVYSMPVVPNVPVFCLGGGLFADTFPIVKGDECVMLCSDRSLDRWFDQGGEQDPIFLTRHSITDAIALVGLRSKPNTLAEWPTDRREIGKQGSLKIAVKDGSVHLGVPSGTDATDNVALASLVKAELQAQRDKLDALVSAFNTHIHQVPAAPGPTDKILAPASGPAPVNDVKSQKVFSD